MADPFAELGFEEEPAAVPAADGADPFVAMGFEPEAAAAPKGDLELLAQGITPQSQLDADAQLASMQAEHGGAGSQALTAAEGIGRGFTLGLTDVVAPAVAGAVGSLAAPDMERAAGPGIDAPLSGDSVFAQAYQAARDDIKARKAANPATAMTGELFGAVAGGLATKGAGGLNAVARLSPSGLVNSAGMAAGSRAAGLATGAVGKAVLGGAVGGAVEGGLSAGLLGASEVAEEPYIADPGLAAEHVLTQAGSGLFLGAGFGGALGLAGGLLSKGAGKLDDAAESMAAKAAPEAAPAQVADDLDTITVNLEAKPAVTTPEQLAAMDARTNYVRQLEQLQAVEGGFDNAVQSETRAIREEMDNVLHGMDQVDEYAGIAAKKRANDIAAQELDVLPSGKKEYVGVVKGRGKDAAPVMREVSERQLQSRAVMDAMIDEVSEARKGLSDVESKGMGQLEKHLRQKADMIEDAFARGDTGEVYHLLDQGVKGQLGKMRSNLSGSNQDLVERLYPSVQKFLEDESQWASLAKSQKLANPSWSARIGASKDASWQGFTSVSGKRAANEWDNIRLANDSAIKGFLSNIGDAGNSRAEEALRVNLRSMARDALDRSKAWGGERLQAEADRIVKQVRSIEDRLDAVAKLRNDAIAGQSSLQQSSTADMMASALGMVSPRAAFAISGTAQAKRKVMLAVAESGNAVATKVVKNAAKLVRLANSGVRAAGRVVPKAAAVAAASVMDVAPQLLSQRKLDTSIQNAQALMDPKSPETRRLIEQAAAVEAEGQPELAQSLVSLEVKRAQLIQNMLPKQQAGLFAPSPRLDPMKERQLKRTVSAAYYPERTMGRLADGVATREEISAMRALFPGMYGQFVSAVEHEFSRSRKVPSREQQQVIHAMTGLTVRPSLEPQRIMSQQATAAAVNEPAKPPSSGRAPSLSPDTMLTRADRLAGGGG